MVSNLTFNNHISVAKKIVLRSFDGYCKLHFKHYNRMSIRGEDNIPSTSFIVCSNHNSHMDMAVLVIASHMTFEDSGFLAAVDYWFEHPARKHLTSLLNLLPIDRRGNDACKLTIRTTLSECRSFFDSDKKKCLILYPQGSRTNKHTTFKKGAALISVKLNVPLLPAFISGTDKAWAKGTKLMRPHPVSVSFGKPIYPSSYSDNVNGPRFSKEIIDNLTHDLKHAVDELEKSSYE